MPQTSPRIEEANRLVDLICDALEAADLNKATATIDAAHVASGARHGIVVVSAPALTFDTWDDVTAAWELHVIAGPATDYLAAWATIDNIIQALHTAALNLAKGEPGQFQPMRGEPLPAYTLTLNPLD